MKAKKKGPAQEYLEQIRKKDILLDCLISEQDALKDKVYRITPSMSGSGGSSGGGNQDKLGSAVSKIVDMKAKIDRTMDAWLDLKQEASALLACLDAPEHCKVLHERYIQYKSFETIAAEMGYTYRGVCYLHGRALQAFGKVLEEHRNRITICMKE